MPSGYEQAASAYNTTQSSTMSGFQIVVELYKGMMGNISQAKAAYQAGKLDEMCNLNDKTFKIIQALRAHLDFEQGGETSLYLDHFYSAIFTALASVLNKENPEESFDEILKTIDPVYQRWVEMAGQDVSPEAIPTEMPSTQIST